MEIKLEGDHLIIKDGQDLSLILKKEDGIWFQLSHDIGGSYWMETHANYWINNTMNINLDKVLIRLSRKQKLERISNQKENS